MHGESSHKEMADVLLRDDFRQNLYKCYSADVYTMKESVEEQITVKIVYEGRATKVLLDGAKCKRSKSTTKSAP